MSSHRPRGCIAALLDLFRGSRRDHQPRPVPTQSAPTVWPYRTRDDFLSPAEGSFFRVLTMALAGRWIICPNVGLRDLFFVPNNRDPTPINKIDRKHVDFVLLDTTTLQPVLAIELDDRSHQRPDRMERDQCVEQVFRTAGLALLRIPVQPTYHTETLRQHIEQATHVQPIAFGPAPTSVAPPIAASMPTPPFSGPMAAPPSTVASQPLPSAPPVPWCPKCGVPLVIRTVRQGTHAGTKFYGCSNYPQCREMKPYPI